MGQGLETHRPAGGGLRRPLVACACTEDLYRYPQIVDRIADYVRSTGSAAAYLDFAESVCEPSCCPVLPSVGEFVDNRWTSPRLIGTVAFMTNKPRVVVGNRKKPIESLAEYERIVKTTPKSKLRTQTYILEVVVAPEDADAFLAAFDASPGPKKRTRRKPLKFSIVKVRNKKSIDALKLVPRSRRRK